MEISFSQFEVYRQCPWKYRLKFVEKKNILLTPAAALGLSLHKALEGFHLSRAGDLKRLVSCYESQWVDPGFPDEPARRHWHDKGLRILKKYFEAELGRRTDIVGVEKEFIYGLGRHTVRGRIDRIDCHPDGSYEIIDYKTNLNAARRQDSAAASASQETLLQLYFYALGARQALGINPNLLTVYFLAAGRCESTPYDGSGEDELKREILKAANAIESQGFTPEREFCPRCGFKEDCAYSSAPGPKNN